MNKVLKFLARPDIFFYTLIWLMFLLVMGTVTQKTIGLYQAQERFFSSNILWLFGVLPTPGGMPTMAIVFIGLTSKLLIEEWNIRKLGTITVHIGAMLLLLGGFITGIYSQEGNMVIKEGDSAGFISDYYDVEFAISNAETGKEIFIHDFSKDKAIKLIKTDIAEFKIIQYFDNCSLLKRTGEIDENLRAMATIFSFQKAPLDKQAENNTVCIQYRIEGEEDNDGIYQIFEDMPIIQTFTKNDIKYHIEIRKKRTYLPFAIELIDFEKQSYGGINMAKSYSSDVILKDNGIEWKSLISMNEPLRYKGYVFYQSSFFVNQRGEEVTVLAVVHNIGRMFPYISSIILTLGLLIHILQSVPAMIRRRNAK